MLVWRLQRIIWNPSIWYDLPLFASKMLKIEKNKKIKSNKIKYKNCQQKSINVILQFSIELSMEILKRQILMGGFTFDTTRNYSKYSFQTYRKGCWRELQIVDTQDLYSTQTRTKHVHKYMLAMPLKMSEINAWWNRVPNMKKLLKDPLLSSRQVLRMLLTALLCKQ